MVGTFFEVTLPRTKTIVGPLRKECRPGADPPEGQETRHSAWRETPWGPPKPGSSRASRITFSPSMSAAGGLNLVGACSARGLLLTGSWRLSKP